MYIIKHRENSTYYARTIYKGQRHFVRDIKEAKKMSYDYASKIWNNLKLKGKYEIIEIKK